MKIEIIGLIRFSYLAIPGKGTSSYGNHKATLDLQRDYLYETQKLSRRIDIFETITLASLKAQTSQDFKFILLIGSDFPDWAKSRLEAMIAGTNIVIEAMPPKMTFRAIRHCFETHFSAGCDVRVTIRLDDDDAISKGWMEHLHMLAMNFEPKGEYSSFVSFLPNGAVLHSPHENILGLPIKTAYLSSPWGIGLAHFAYGNFSQNIYTHTHASIQSYLPTILVPNEHYFLRTAHGDNLTNDKLQSERFLRGLRPLQNVSADEFLLGLSDNFGIDFERALELISGL